MVMDFVERLKDKINEMPSLPIECKLGYLGTSESLVLYPLPGSRITQTYMNGATDQALNYEIAMKSKEQSKINATLWTIQTELEQVTEVKSKDGSFEFQDLLITNKPFINYLDEQGWFVFLLNVQANITVLKEEK